MTKKDNTTQQQDNTTQQQDSKSTFLPLGAGSPETKELNKDHIGINNAAFKARDDRLQVIEA